MPNTYTLLETISVGAAGASSVTFNSIPTTGYTDLVIKGSARTAGSSVGSELRLTFNGNSANYSWRRLQGNGSAVFSDSNVTYGGVYNQLILLGSTNGNSSTANTFGNCDIYIPNYVSANHKSLSVDLVSENNATEAYATNVAGLWSNTAAVTSITLSTNSSSFTQYSTFSLYGVSALGTTPTKAPKATGGSIIQTDGTYWYHAFLSSGTFTPATALSCDVLVVAGGGGGGMQQAGGGGAGGVLAFASQSVGTSAQTVTVGAGGARSTVNTANGSNGSNSQFASLTASVGGGGGGSRFDSGGSAAGVGATGGSGGGGGYTGAGGSGTSGQGNAGATGNSSGGGGGGAGAVGGNLGGGAGTTSVTNWGALTTALSTTGLGVSGYLAGGGGGGGWTTTGGTGGSGGGGNGGYPGQPTNGTANTGSGGGGGYYDGSSPGNYYGANGGSGLVIIRYLA